MKEGADLKEKLDKLEREMKKTGRDGLEPQKEIGHALASQEKIQDMLEGDPEVRSTSRSSRSPRTAMNLCRKSERSSKRYRPHEERSTARANKYMKRCASHGSSIRRR